MMVIQSFVLMKKAMLIFLMGQRSNAVGSGGDRGFRDEGRVGDHRIVSI